MSHEIDKSRKATQRRTDNTQKEQDTNEGSTKIFDA
jgi:hypothetical protein